MSDNKDRLNTLLLFELPRLEVYILDEGGAKQSSTGIMTYFDDAQLLKNEVKALQDEIKALKEGKARIEMTAKAISQIADRQKEQLKNSVTHEEIYRFIGLNYVCYGTVYYVPVEPLKQLMQPKGESDEEKN